MINLRSMTVALLFGTLLLNSCSKKRGCTDPGAINFDNDAKLKRNQARPSIAKESGWNQMAEGW